MREETHTAAIERSAEAEIRELIQDWATSVGNLDLEGAVAHHADDMLMFDVPPPVQIRGIDGYRRTWPQFFDWLSAGGTFKIASLDVTAGEDVAYATALLHCGRITEPDANVEPGFA